MLNIYFINIRKSFMSKKIVNIYLWTITEEQENFIVEKQTIRK